MPLTDPKGSLARDRVVRGILGLLVLAAVPLLFPILSDAWRATYGHHARIRG